jgi:hypothetical protein
MENDARTPDHILGSPLERGISYGLPKFEDPFSDDESEPFTPMTEVSNYELSIQAIPETTADAERSTVTCCRCDCVNSFEPETRGSATCEKCTRAFCRKCRVESAQITAFDQRGKAFITRDRNEVDYFWFCSSCGVKSGIPRYSVLTTGCVVSVDVRCLSCGPCQQKANRKSLTIALIKAKPDSSGLGGGDSNWSQTEPEENYRLNLLPRCTGSIVNGTRCQISQGRRNWMVRLRRWTF